MAKRNLGRVQGASVFHTDNALTSDTTKLDYSDIVPTDIKPLAGDLIIAKGKTSSEDTNGMLVFEVVDVVYSDSALLVVFLYKIESGTGSTIDVDYASDDDIFALFQTEFCLVNNDDINNLFT